LQIDPKVRFEVANTLRSISEASQAQECPSIANCQLNSVSQISLV